MKTILESWKQFLNEEEKQTIITFDFDDTLKHTFDPEFGWTNEGATPFSRMAVKLSKRYPSYIVTSRMDREDSREEIQKLVEEIGLEIKDIYMVGGKGGGRKYPKLIELGSTVHFDDDDEEWKDIEEHAPHITVGKIDWETGKLENEKEIIDALKMVKEDFQDDVRRGHEKMKRRLTRGGGSKVKVKGYKLAPVSRSKSAPPGYGGSLEEAQEDDEDLYDFEYEFGGWDLPPEEEREEKKGGLETWSDEEKLNFLYYLAMVYVERGDIKKNPQDYVFITPKIEDLPTSKLFPKAKGKKTGALFMRWKIADPPLEAVYVDKETFDNDFLESVHDFMHEIQHVNQYHSWDSLKDKQKKDYMVKFGVNPKTKVKGFGDLVKAYYERGGSYQEAPHELEAIEFQRKMFKDLSWLSQEFIDWWRKNEE